MRDSAVRTQRFPSSASPASTRAVSAGHSPDGHLLTASHSMPGFPRRSRSGVDQRRRWMHPATLGPKGAATRTNWGDDRLFRAGDAAAIDDACRRSAVGKLLPRALYVHRSALDALDPLLRIDEGCARAYLGEI